MRGGVCAAPQGKSNRKVKLHLTLLHDLHSLHHTQHMKPYELLYSDTGRTCELYYGAQFAYSNITKKKKVQRKDYNLVQDMNKHSVRLPLYCISFFLYLLCEASEDMCTVENLPPLVNQSNSKSTISFNAIITNYSFNCCGYVTEWGALINEPNRMVRSHNLTFQVWRPQNEESCRYRWIGSNKFLSSQLAGNTIAVNAQERIRFQTNDIIGILVQNTSISLSASVRLRSVSEINGVTINEEVMRHPLQQESCVNLTAARIKEVPVITAIIVPAPCPQLTTMSPSATTAPHTTPTNSDTEGGIVAGITITVILAVLLCAIMIIVSLVVVFARKSKRKKPRQKTFGKAKFIRSVYILPTRYRATKDDTTNNTEQTSSSIKEKEEEGEGQGVEREAEQEASNSDLYVNQQEFTKSSDPLTPSSEAASDDLYVNNPLTRRYFRDKEEKEAQHDTDNDKHLYVNQAAFVQPPSLDTPSNKAQPPNGDTSSNKDEGNDNQLYVNNLRARQNLKDLSLYENQMGDISVTPNRAYGVTDRSVSPINNLQQLQQQNENGEDEYVYVDVNKDSPEEEYEDMATFHEQSFKKL